jgi:hypothetical protein
MTDRFENGGVSEMKPNCSTCTISHCPLFAQPGRKPSDSSVHSRITLAISKVGCLSHTQAREYLMKDVIEELETLQKYPLNFYAVVYLSDVRNLIKKGVKKE